MTTAYRFWCADCRYRTPCLPVDQGSELLANHYREKHPGMRPAGRAELVPADLRALRGCVLAALVLLLLLVLAALFVPHVKNKLGFGVPGSHRPSEVGETNLGQQVQIADTDPRPASPTAPPTATDPGANPLAAAVTGAAVVEGTAAAPASGERAVSRPSPWEQEKSAPDMTAVVRARSPP